MKQQLTRFSFLAAFLVLAGQGCFSSAATGPTGPGGVFVTTDYGDTWQQISLLPTAEGVDSLAAVSAFRLVHDPQDSSALYWASRGDGLFYTYNSGRSWQHAAAPLNAGFVYDVQVSPTDKCLIYATKGALTYRSNDCSRSWREVHKEDRSSARAAALLAMRGPQEKLFLGKINGDLLVSTDNGDEWTTTHRLGTRIVGMAQDAVSTNTLYIATRDDGLFRSRDAGVTWQQLDEPLREYSGALRNRGMIAHPYKTDHLYWVSTYGILWSADGGDSWQPYQLLTSPGSVDIYGFAVGTEDDAQLFYTTFDGVRSTFYRSADNGESWSTERLPSGQVPTVLQLKPDDGSILYLGLTIPEEN